MLKFFRKIRLKLLSENKFSKYLIYAIGEIVLVVIGILIALSINNWNEDRKNRQKEKDALIELFQDIESNNVQLKKIDKDEREIVNSIESLITEYEERGTFPEDSLQVYFGKALIGQRQDFVKTAYSVLLASDIGLITNKKLRYDIAEYYEKEIPYVERDALDTWNEWYDFILPIIREVADDWKWGEYLVPKSMDTIFDNQELYSLLKTNKVNHLGVILSANRSLIESEKLLDQIKPLTKKNVE